MSDRPTINRIWASGSIAEIKDPGDEKYAQGWISEIPTYEVFNYIQNKSDTTILALGERGIFEWGSDIEYAQGALTWNEADNTVYVSKVSVPDVTKSPDTNPTEWEKSSIQITRTDFDNLNSEIMQHISAKGDVNIHELKPHDVDSYSREEIDEKFHENDDSNNEHISDYNNPHNDDAESIGAVPVTGGTYEGAVTMAANILNLDEEAKGKILSQDVGVVISVEDSGLGVSADGVPGIFENGKITAFGKLALKDSLTYTDVDAFPASGGTVGEDAVHSPYFHSTSTAPANAQGAWLSWNGTGGGGEANLTCNKGEGGGGFRFSTVNSDNTTETGLVSISGTGDLNASGTVSEAGQRVYSPGNPPSQFNSGGWFRDVDTGFIIQFGYQSSAGNGSFQITYPMAFPNSCINLTATRVGSTSAPTVAVYDVSLTGAVIKQSDGGDGGSYWLAVGF
ncbi:hypothetical protein EHW66_17945 [Erwinia psidii]|uniref:gp53-like domain-containing protein n=1 Tax=Erwinia psidii TaxID=69224 RepID=UPI00226B0E22|nr:hypothetical protein [Erwinia psidii]MCX8966796.1 hypothetical protein [Erwinia psidii]